MSDVAEGTNDVVKKSDVAIMTWSSVSHVSNKQSLLTARTKLELF